jgi:hypothetical protein
VVLQHDSTSHLATCIAAPLVTSFLPGKEVKIRPILQIEGRAMQLQTDRLAAISRRSIGQVVISVEDDQDMIKNAIDRLFNGF